MPPSKFAAQVGFQHTWVWPIARAVRLNKQAKIPYHIAETAIVRAQHIGHDSRARPTEQVHRLHGEDIVKPRHGRGIVVIRRKDVRVVAYETLVTGGYHTRAVIGPVPPVLDPLYSVTLRRRGRPCGPQR